MAPEKDTFALFLFLLTAAAVFCACSAAPGHADPARISCRIEIPLPAPAADCIQVPLHAPFTMPDALAATPLQEISATLSRPGEAEPITGQIVRDPQGQNKIWWVAPQLRAGKEVRWTATLSLLPGSAAGKKDDRQGGAAAAGFAWKDDPGKRLDLLFDGRKVLETMYAHDPSTPESVHETYKVYHHVCDRKSRRITKGPGGLYTHHRGLFIGWNRLTFDGKEYDFWHMKNTFQVHVKTLELTAGPVLARHKALIHWIDGRGRPLIAEERTITVFDLPAPAVALIDFSTRLEAISGKVFLNGDPEHGGIQYRPHNGVAEGDAGAKAVYLFHREGVDAHKEKNLPWAAETYGLHGGFYTVQHMNHPGNPRGGVYSAYRDYGRFGAFFTETIENGKTLPLRYRIYVAEGQEMVREKMKERYAAFTAAPVYMP